MYEYAVVGNDSKNEHSSIILYDGSILVDVRGIIIAHFPISTLRYLQLVHLSGVIPKIYSRSYRVPTVEV